MTILNVRGTAYEMGYATGLLVGNDIQDNINAMYDYAVKEGNQEAQKYVPIPDAIFNKIIPGELKALKKLLDLSWETTRMYTPLRYKDEMQGIADATGIDYLDIRRINLFPELTRAACTMIGAWGESTSDG